MGREFCSVVHDDTGMHKTHQAHIQANQYAVPTSDASDACVQPQSMDVTIQ